MPLKVSPLSIARTYLGTREVDGPGSNPFVLAWLSRVAPWASDDEVPWCGAFVYHCAAELELTRPKERPAAARSWLLAGRDVPLDQAEPGFDVVVFARPDEHGLFPGPGVLDAPGHVAFFVAGHDGSERYSVSRVGEPRPPYVPLSRQADHILVLGGNQGNAVSIAPFPVSRILGVRRLYVEA